MCIRDRDTNKKSNKKIRLTNLGALNDKVSSKESTVISSFQLPLESNGSVYESELEKLDNTKSYHSYFMINPQSINSIMAGKNVLLRNVRILGTLPNCFNDMKVTIDEDELVLYAYSYDLPIHNTTFTPELNCYEVTVTDISLFSQGLGISKHLINKDGLKIISALFSKNKYDITITKEQYDIAVSYTHLDVYKRQVPLRLHIVMARIERIHHVTFTIQVRVDLIIISVLIHVHRILYVTLLLIIV